MRSLYLSCLLGLTVTIGIGRLAAPSPPVLDVPRLMRAFEDIESGGREQVRGDGGRAWGLFQFHRARWGECGGAPSDWGRAGRAEQERVMRNAIARYLRTCPRGSSIEQQVKHAARCHNGWGKASIKYANELWRRYGT